MNINKTNPFGLYIAKNGFKSNAAKSLKVLRDHTNDTVSVNINLLKHNPNQKIIRVSKAIIEQCKLIDINSIKENINSVNFNFRSLFIMLDNDTSGFVKVERFGSDYYFTAMDNLKYGHDVGYGFVYNAYSFESKNFILGKGDDRLKDYNYERSVFIIKLLTYLIFGDITEKYLRPKMKTGIGLTRIINNSSLNITFCDTLWKQRINTDGFKVSGHFRLQPIGEKRNDRKLIWIEEFSKKGYNRKATVENIK